MTDPERYPGTNVYVNLLDLRRANDLELAEAVFSTRRNKEFFDSPDTELAIAPDDRFSLEHLRRIHYHLFQDVYSWAGELRSFNMSKGFLRPFSEPEVFLEFGESIQFEIGKDSELYGGDICTAARRLGHYMSMVNIMHPFPEGNGRTQRAFIWLLAQDAGYKFSWNLVSKYEVHGAAISLMRDGTKEGMESLIGRIIEPV